MNKKLQDLAEWALRAAKAAGARECRVTASRGRAVEIGYRERKAETIKEASTQNLSIELFVDGRFSAQSTSDLRKPAMADFIARAVASTRLLAEDPFRTLPDPKCYEGRAKTDLGIVDPDYARVAPEDRHKMAWAVEEACFSHGGPKVISVTSGCGDTHEQSVMLASNGFEGCHESTSFWAGAEMTVQDAGDRRPNSYFFASSFSHAGLPKPEQIGKETAQRTLALVGARKIPTATLPVIVENRVVPRLLGGMLTAMSGRNIQQKQSFLAGKQGQKIASEHLTIIDDPLIAGGLGSRHFDSDGLTGRKRVMIEGGVLNSFYVGWYYSRKLGCEPTTGSSSNLIIPPGKRSIAEIMKDLGRGLLITEFIGGNSNATTGDTSIGIVGSLFDKGEIVQPVAEMNLAGNHLTLWKKLAEAANDPWLYSSERTPSLVFTDIVIAGV